MKVQNHERDFVRICIHFASVTHTLSIYNTKAIPCAKFELSYIKNNQFIFRFLARFISIQPFIKNRVWLF